MDNTMFNINSISETRRRRNLRMGENERNGGIMMQKKKYRKKLRV